MWLKIVLAAAAIMAVILILAVQIASSNWNKKTLHMVQKWTQPVEGRGTGRVSFREFDRLPTPVARYLRMVLKEGQPLIRSAKITQSGEFNMSRTGENWKPFDAIDYVSIAPYGFVWDASIHMAPLVSIKVRDSYLSGRSSMSGKILSLMTVVNAQGSRELNESALQRYLAEAVWYPTALLPSENLKWSAIDDRRALATLTDSGISVSLEFHFNGAGEISGVFSSGRYYEENGKYRREAWAGYHHNYHARDGMLIPIEAEVEWQFRDRKLPYWKGKMEAVDYDFRE